MSDPARKEIKVIFSRRTEQVLRRGWLWRRAEIIDTSDEWRAEKYEADSDGGVAVAIFTALVQSFAPAATPGGC